MSWSAAGIRTAQQIGDLSGAATYRGGRVQTTFHLVKAMFRAAIS